MEHLNVTNLSNYEEILNKSNMKYYEFANKVFQQLGTGHTEFIYHRAMEVELRLNQINYETEKRVLIKYVNNDFYYDLGEERIDLYIVDEKVIIELKAVVNPPRETELAQIRKYYRELKKDGIKPVYGIIINFPQPGVKAAKEEIDFYEIKFS